MKTRGRQAHTSKIPIRKMKTATRHRHLRSDHANSVRAVSQTISDKPLRPMPASPCSLISELHTAETPGERSRRELQALMATAEVKRILNELDDRLELQLPKHQKKQPQAEEVQWRTDRAEMYSPP